MIYALQASDGGPVKIGCSGDVPARHRQLEAYYGRPLTLLATFPGGRDEERAIHLRLASSRIGRSEQFRPTAEVMTFLGRPLLVGANPAAVEAMPMPTTIGVRASAEWASWVDELAKHCRTDLAKLIDSSLVEYAKLKGFPKPPPERVP